MPGALERTYYTDVDYALDNSSAGNFIRHALWSIKACLKKEILSANCAAVPAWTVLGSSDSVTGALDGVDRWGGTFDVTKIVRGAANSTNPNSWILLKHPVDSLWLLLQYVGSSDVNAIISWFTIGAPTGGSNTARPTTAAGTYSSFILDGSQGFVESSASAGRVHRTFDQDGYFIWALSRNGGGHFKSILAIQRCAETKTGDIAPWVAIWDQTTPAGSGAVLGIGQTNAIGSSYSQWRATASGPSKALMGNSFSSVVPAFPAGANTTMWLGTTLTGTDAVDGKYVDFPMHLLATSGNIGVKGRCYDWRISAGPTNGDIFPAAAPDMTHLYMGNVWLPWKNPPTL